MTSPGLRERYLDAMGIPVWVLRDTVGPEQAVGEVQSVDAPDPEPAAGEVQLAGASDPEPAAGEARLADAGGTVSKEAARGPGARQPAIGAQGASKQAVPPPGAPGTPAQERAVDWSALQEEVRTCTQCALHRGRTQTVFGVGSQTADLLIIGEAPGAEEDRRGEPFVGRAGQLLNAMLAAIHLDREDVYIANILKCRPPNNRDPKSDEAATCTPYLQRQIDLLRPRVILALGRIAAQWLLRSDAPIGRLRGRTFEFGAGATPLVVSYHPAYLLRSPLAKSKSWGDLKLVKRLLAPPE